jgi:hypothetical protein
MNAFSQFFRSKPKSERLEALRVKAWALDMLGTEMGYSCSVNEIECNDPACFGLETILLIMHEEHKTRAVKIMKGLSDITQQDVEEALRPVVSPAL